MRDIIDMPMDEFNDLLSKHELTEEQLTVYREIRRRGYKDIPHYCPLCQVELGRYYEE